MATTTTEAPVQKVEEEIPSSSKPVTGDQKFLYLLVSFFTASLPLYLYRTIFGLGAENFALFGVVTFFSALILTHAFRNVAISLQRRMNYSRTALQSLLQGETKKKKKEEDTASSREATAFSIMYNSVLFHVVFISLAFYVFRSASGPYNYVASVSLASAAVSLYSATQV
mmetsp:Transcript_22689/g.31596  ORF Transcript_22689/g.31596 Transcript_22689/m.31596 type:complete len:170 (-) Transcript_22689:31-540(-)